MLLSLQDHRSLVRTIKSYSTFNGWRTSTSLCFNYLDEQNIVEPLVCFANIRLHRGFLKNVLAICRDNEMARLRFVVVTVMTACQCWWILFASVILDHEVVVVQAASRNRFEPPLKIGAAQ
jgi:hypothetical protein